MIVKVIRTSENYIIHYKENNIALQVRIDVCSVILMGIGKIMV